MKTFIKKFIVFLITIFIYFLPNIILDFDYSFYESLEGFKLPPWLFGVIWAFIYIFIAIFITINIFKQHNNRNGSYKRLIFFFVLNYLFMVLFEISFFKLNNLFLSYVFCLFTFITILISQMEASLIEKKTSYLLLPYVIWSLIASVLSIILYLKN